jgi:hypothetical protein
MNSSRQNSARDATEDAAERLRRVALALHLGNREGITAALAEAGVITGDAAAFAQIEALTGSRDTVMYFRASKKLKKGAEISRSSPGRSPICGTSSSSSTATAATSTCSRMSRHH